MYCLSVCTVHVRMVMFMFMSLVGNEIKDKRRKTKTTECFSLGFLSVVLITLLLCAA